MIARRSEGIFYWGYSHDGKYYMLCHVTLPLDRHLIAFNAGNVKLRFGFRYITLPVLKYNHIIYTLTQYDVEMY